MSWCLESQLLILRKARISVSFLGQAKCNVEALHKSTNKLSLLTVNIRFYCAEKIKWSWPFHTKNDSAILLPIVYTAITLSLIHI